MYPKNYFKKFSKFYLLVLLLLIFTVPIALSGCGGGGGSSSGSLSNSATSSSTISGTVDGGTTPLNYQVTVYLYESGSSTPLGSSTTNNGNFTINFNNPSNPGLLYIVVQGSGANSNIQLLSIVESSQNSNLSESGVVVNELSTVASEYIANAFNMNFNPNNDSLNFPSNLSGVSLTTALNNLITQFNNLYNSKGSNAGSLNSSVSLSTKNTMDILADAISSCVSNPSGTVCSTLYNDASSSSGEQISEIVYSIITNNTSNLPSNYSLSNIYTLASDESSTTGWSIPSTAPASLMFNMPVSINTSYMPSSISNTTGIGPIAIDDSGNIWVPADTYSTSAGTFTDKLLEISNGSIVKTINLGGSSIASSSDYNIYGIAIDSAGNIWIPDQTYNSSSNSYTDQLIEITNGSIVNTIPMPANNGAGIAIDSGGNIWIPNYTSYSTTNTLEYTDELVEVSNGSIKNIFSLPSNATGEPEGIAIDASGNIWISTYNYNNSTNSSSNQLVEVSKSGSVLRTINLPGYNSGAIAIDPSGNIWLAVNVVANSTSSYEIIEISNNNIAKTIPIYNDITNGNEGINSIAIDSGGNVWVDGYQYDPSTNTYGGQLFEISNGAIADTINIGDYDPFYITIQSGNILVSADNFQNVNNTPGYYSGNIIEVKDAAEGGEYFPYSGPEFPGVSGSKFY